MVFDPTHDDITRAGARLAATTLYPSFSGGVYEFTSADLSTGCWHQPEDALFEGFGISVPRFPADTFLVRQARFRILIEDALHARFALPRPKPQR